MSTDAEGLKTIADNIEAAYQSLRVAAANISGLLAAGNATCDEVKAYNAWALAIFNLQSGMLDTLRANGEQNVPDKPNDPTLFGLNGVDGAAMLDIDCAQMADQNLSGLLASALRGPSNNTTYLNSQQIRMVTTDPYANNPTASPSYSSLLQIQQLRQNQPQSGLGSPIVVLIIIAAVALAVSVAVVAIMSYLKANAADEANTQQTRLQADTFAKYTSARLQCLQSCLAGGGTVDDCVAKCKALITEPDIQLPGDVLKKWGTLQWIGLSVVIGVGAIVAWKLYQRHQAGESLLPELRLPELHFPMLNGAEDDGGELADYGDDDEEYIDADYTETAA